MDRLDGTSQPMPAPTTHATSLVSRLLRDILHSPVPLYTFARWGLALIAILFAADTLRLAIDSVRIEHVHRKDFIQEYLLGRALLDGTSPYLPIPELATRYIGSLPDPILPHPTPHPPPAALLGLPLAHLDYASAARVWLVVEIVFILISLALSCWALNLRIPFWAFLILLSALLGTDAYLYELVFGQLQTVILLLLVTAWILLRRRQDWIGGACLGIALALKMAGWPIILLMLIQRRWRALGAAAVLLASLNGLAAVAMGPKIWVDYYLRIAPYQIALYRSDPKNLSLWTLGWRIFSGTVPTVTIDILAPPLFTWQAGAVTLSALVPAACVVLAVVAAAKVKSFDAAFVMLCCVSALVNPIAWSFYGLLATPALVWLWWRLRALGFPPRATCMSLACTAMLYVRTTQLHHVAARLSGQTLDSAQYVTVSFGASLLTLLPTATLVLLTYLVWRTEQMKRLDA